MDNKCCICEQVDKTKGYTVHMGYTLKICQRCSLVFLSKIPDSLDKFIDDSQDESASSQDLEFWSVPSLYDRHHSIFNHFFEQRYQRMLLYNIPKGAYLDVGSGYGFWVNFLKEKKHQCFGIDVSPSAVAYCNERYGKCADIVSFEKYRTDQKFAVIFMFDVLEHFVRPDLMLKKAYELLLPGGIVYIQVPNVLGLKIPYGHSLGLPYHVWQFNFRSLRLALSKANFKKNMRSWTGIQGVIGEYEKGGPSKFRKISWRVANSLKIGNRIQMIGQKKH